LIDVVGRNGSKEKRLLVVVKTKDDKDPQMRGSNKNEMQEVDRRCYKRGT
jgi:hypothetical protein